LNDIRATIYPAILGALIALISVYLTNRSTTQRLRLQFELEREARNKDFIRDKLEELYLLHEAWLNALATSYLPFLSVMKGEMTYDDALDLFIKNNKSPTVDFKRLQMLVDLYFPEIKVAFDQLSAARDGANAIKSAHKREYKAGHLDGLPFALPFIEAQQLLQKQALVVRAQIIEQSGRYREST
jgi:hypothetical protein